MVQIRLDNDPDFVLPVFVEDLETFTVMAAAAPIVKSSVPKPPPPPPRREVKMTPVQVDAKGPSVVFEPMPGPDGLVPRYTLWLVNDSAADYLVEFDLYANDRNLLRADEKLSAGLALEIGTMPHDALNNLLEAEIRLQQITTAGLEEPEDIVFRLKPKQFANAFQHAPIINTWSHVFYFHLYKGKRVEQEAPEELKQYAQQKAKEAQKSKSQKESFHSFSALHKAFNVEDYAEFLPEIDLHIEKLTNDPRKLTIAEIVQLQLYHFERYMDRAVRLGVPRVFIIHGVGEGKLRDRIHDSLRRNPHVVSYRNEYHKKYGYGATEAIMI